MFNNDILERLRESLDLRAKISGADFIEQNIIYDGSFFSTRYRDYQKDILNDFSRKLSVIKMSQTGLTTTFMMKIIAFSKIFPGKKAIIFTMPTDKMVKTFAKTRLLPVIEENGRLFPRLSNSDTRSADLVKISKLDVHLLGCESDNSAFSIPSDYNIYDEVDETKQNAIDNLSSRLQGSALRMEHKLSTPTFTGFGIHKEYENSSKGTYQTKCDSCGEWNDPKFIPSTFVFGDKRISVEFFEDLGLEAWRDILQNTTDIWVPCSKCGSRLIFGDPMRSEWVHEFDSRKDHRGYAVTPFCLEKYNPTEQHNAFYYIFQKFIDHSVQGNLEKWYRSVLGVATLPSNDRIGEQAVRDVMGTKRCSLKKGDPIYIGIDMGQTCFVTFITPEGSIAKFQGIPIKLLKGKVEEWMDYYDVKGGCIDLLPETHLSQEIRAMTKNKIMPVLYSTRKNGEKIEEIQDEEHELSYLYVDRNHALDRVAYLIKEKKMSINGWDGLDDAVLIRHFADNFKETKDTGIIRWLCVHSTDHGFHSAGYAYTAREYFGGEGLGRGLGFKPFIFSMVDSALFRI